MVCSDFLTTAIPGPSMDTFTLKQNEQALHGSIVIRLAGAAHRAHDPVFIEPLGRKS